MYYYIYDSFLSDKKYTNTLARIENRLTDLGINGKINRLSFLKNIPQVLSEEIKRGVKTVVVVGNDKTLSQMINLIADLNIVIGFIPVTDSQISRLVAIPPEVEACNVLSARIIKKLDLGKINDYYFITSLELSGKKISLECDGSYFITLDNQNDKINISNLNYCYQKTSLPTDGYLDLFIENTQKKLLSKSKSTITHLKNKVIKISSEESMPILLSDENIIIKTPATIKTVPKKLKLIVGKERIF